MKKFSIILRASRRRRMSREASVLSKLKGSRQARTIKFCVSGAGFTLIELLIAIALIGILATVIIIAINPAEMMARGRDTGRKEAVRQLGNAIQSFAISLGRYPNVDILEGQLEFHSENWLDVLVSRGELKVAPSLIGDLNGTLNNNCATAGAAADGSQYYSFKNNYCYINVSNDNNPVIFTLLESSEAEKKCSSVPDSKPYFVWTSGISRTCLICKASAPLYSDVTNNACKN